MPLTPQGQAMIQGTQQGNQQAQSMLPSAFQTQGRAQPTNPYEGSLNLIVTQIMEVASGVGGQGQAYREQKERLYKFAYEIQKLNNQLTDMAMEGVAPQGPSSSRQSLPAGFR